MKYSEWANEWMINFVKINVVDRTYLKYSAQMKKYIVPLLGKFELIELDGIVLQRFVTYLREMELSASTINGILVLLKASLKRAYMMNIVEREYSSFITYSQKRDNKVKCFSRSEQKKLENFIFEDRKYSTFGILLALYTGMRIGELLALRWCDVELNNGYISVSHTCHDSWLNGRYKKILTSPKTQASRRLIPIPSGLFPILSEMKQNARSTYVVSGRKKEGCQIRSYQRCFSVLLEKLDIPHKGFHSLRHTFATRALEYGMDIKTLSDILGHSDATVTLQRYAHSMLEHKYDAMERVCKEMMKDYTVM